MSEKSNGHQNSYNPSALMSAYNFAKWHGKKSGQFDERRVNKALGILMSGELQEKLEKYGTTLKTCDCPDWQYRTIHCKHRIGLMIKVKHDKIMDEEIYLPMAA